MILMIELSGPTVPSLADGFRYLAGGLFKIPVQHQVTRRTVYPWYSALNGLIERIEWGGRCMGALGDQWHSYFRKAFWRQYRDGWASLLASRSVLVHGVQFVWWDGELSRV